MSFSVCRNVIFGLLLFSMLASCTKRKKPGAEFVGAWKDLSSGPSGADLQIFRSGDYFTVSHSRFGMNNVMSATYENGAMHVSTPQGVLLATYDAATDRVTFLGVFQCMAFREIETSEKQVRLFPKK